MLRCFPSPALFVTGASMIRISALTALAGLALLSGCSAAPPEAPAQDAAATPAPAVEEGYVHASDGVKLYYRKVGNGEKTIIAPSRLFVFEDFRRLGDRHTLISYDMRNRGRSDRVTDDARITIEADVEDLESVRDHFGVDRFTPIGYSYLGLVVVMYAMQHPDRVERIVQIGAVPLRFGTTYRPEYAAPDWEASLPAEGLAHIRSLREENRHETHPREYCVEEWKVLRHSLVADPGKVDALGPDPCDMENEWPVNLVRHLDLHFVQSVQKLDIPREEIAGVTVPVLTIHGTLDRNAPYGAGREWAYLLPDARLLTIRGAAHQCFAEQPGLVFPAIETFLAGGWPERAERVTEDPRAPESAQEIR